MIKKLRIKFICVLMTVAAVLLCVIFGMIIGFTQANLEDAAMDALQRGANNPGFLPNRPEDAVGLPYFVLTRDMLGNIRVSGTMYTDSYEEEELIGFWNQTVNAESETGSIEGYHLRYLRSNRRMSTSVVFVDVSSHVLTMGHLVRTCVMIGALSLVLLFGAAVLLSGWMTRPVEKAWNQQRQFVADASHELKTPLTVIMTNAELLQSEPENQSYIAGIVTMSRHMRALVEGLLELARVDNGAVKTSLVPLDFSMLVADGVLPFEPLYFEKALTLQTRIEEGIHVRGSVSHLQQVVEILLDNAMKYSHPGGQVWLRLQRQGNHALLTVANTGNPIAPEELKRIFERFYRADKARSRDGSFGLGLSIAENIVSQHRGKIWAESHEGVNTFFVQLPIL